MERAYEKRRFAFLCTPYFAWKLGNTSVYFWFPSGFSHIGYGEYHIIRSNRWLKTPIDRINREDYIFGYWFPTYKKYIPYRIRILKLALKDLERIKEEYGKD